MSLSIEISAIYIALLSLLTLTLALGVVRLRLKLRVGLGDGGHESLQRAIRTHANTVEYVPMALLLLLAIENTWHLAWLSHLLGCMLFLGRALHAIGLNHSSGVSQPRFLGTALTWLMMLIASLAILGCVLSHAVQ